MNCMAPVRLILTAIERSPVPSGALPGAQGIGGPIKPDVAADPTCPSGYVFSGNLCVRGAQETSHTCEPEDIADCEVQCDRGDAASCGNAGNHYAHSDGSATDWSRAFKYFQKGCEKGNAASCYGVGALQAFGSETIKKDPGAAEPTLRRACELGSAEGCETLGDMYYLGQLPRNPSLAATYLRRGCDGGAHSSCANLGALYSMGAGIRRICPMP